MNEFPKVGDHVIARREGSAIEGEVSFVGSTLLEILLPNSEYIFRCTFNLDWSFEIVPPKVVLPKEPGVYAGRSDNGTALFRLMAKTKLSSYGTLYQWEDVGWGQPTINDGPFTLLAPVSKTAKKVLDAVGQFAWADGFTSQLAAVAAQFGVTE